MQQKKMCAEHGRGNAVRKNALSHLKRGVGSFKIRYDVVIIMLKYTVLTF